jgi:hypothetical protein
MFLSWDIFGRFKYQESRTVVRCYVRLAVLWCSEQNLDVVLIVACPGDDSMGWAVSKATFLVSIGCYNYEKKIL